MSCSLGNRWIIPDAFKDFYVQAIIEFNKIWQNLILELQLNAGMKGNSTTTNADNEIGSGRLLFIYNIVFKFNNNLIGCIIEDVFRVVRRRAGDT